MGKISETKEVTPTKIGLHAFQVNLYSHEFFELILFFDPHGLSVPLNAFVSLPLYAFLVTPTLCLHFLSSFFLIIHLLLFCSDFV